MQFISVRDFRNKSAAIWKRLGKTGEIVITSNGKPVAILTATSEMTFSESLSALRRARALEALESLQRYSVKENISEMSLDEINAEISKARKSKAA